MKLVIKSIVTCQPIKHILKISIKSNSFKAALIIKAAKIKLKTITTEY